MKTERVRISKVKMDRLREVAAVIPGSSATALVERGIDIFLEQESQGYVEAFREARKRIEGKRNPGRTAK